MRVVFPPLQAAREDQMRARASAEKRRSVGCLSHAPSRLSRPLLDAVNPVGPWAVSMGNFHHDVLDISPVTTRCMGLRASSIAASCGISPRSCVHRRHCSAKIVETLHLVHRQRCFIRIGDRFVWFDEHNAFSDTGDNLLEL